VLFFRDYVILSEEKRSPSERFPKSKDLCLSMNLSTLESIFRSDPDQSQE